MRKTRYSAFAALLLLFLLLFAAPVFGEDAYIGIPGNGYYNAQSGSYVFFPEGSAKGLRLFSRVPNGMITPEPVTVSADPLLNMRLFRNGEDVTEEGFSEISEPGEYVVSVQQSSGSSVSRPLSFTVIGRVTGLLNSYTAPAGFYITAAARDNADIPYSNTAVSLEDEGRYRIELTCPTLEKSSIIEFSVDHTAPVLQLAAVQDGIAKGPVDISDLEPGTSVYILLDGRQISYSSVLDTSGSYHIYLADSAGNSTEYDFTIAVYFNAGSILFFAVVIAVASALLIYLVRSRVRMRVR